LSGAAAEGIFIPSSKLYVTADLAANDPQKKVIDKFIADYKAKYNKVPATFAGNGYDAMMMILRAVEKAGLDKGKIRNTIEGTKGYVGVTALYDYSPTDHFGARADSVVMLTVKGGTFALAK
jgi:branched-chain amino acid transport system substrate-binding protein